MIFIDNNFEIKISSRNLGLFCKTRTFETADAHRNNSQRMSKRDKYNKLNAISKCCKKKVPLNVLNSFMTSHLPVICYRYSTGDLARHESNDKREQIMTKTRCLKIECDDLTSV